MEGILMNKKIIALTVAAMTVLGAASLPAAAEDEPVTVIINGEALVIPEGDTQPYIEEGRTLVPMRAIFEALGAYINWDGETKTVVSYDPVSDVSITMQVDSATIFVGETPIELDVPARLVNDRTVVPVRAVSEGMHSQVDWDENTRTVTITKDMEKAE